MLYVLNLIAFMRDRVDTAKDRGATATEYALLIVGICIALGAAALVFGTDLANFFSGLADRLGIPTN
jgi:Flp pilus assembly pilin Flp